MTLYKIRTWNNDIEEIDALRVTANFAIVAGHNGKERREALLDSYGFMGHSREEAKQWKIAHCEREVEAARESLRRAEAALKEAEAI